MATEKKIAAETKIKHKNHSAGYYVFLGFVYLVSIILAVMSIIPFWVMIVNATRSTPEIQGLAISLIPSKSLMNNMKIIATGNFDAIRGFFNSLIISCGSTVLAVYFSTLTAYAIVVYRWKLRRPFFTFIMAVMMIPAQVITVGFYQMVWKVGLTNTFWPLILPSIANPAMVFFMKQYMEPAFSLEIVQSARIDGAREFYTFNVIALPIMKPAIATQAIFTFVSSWNNLFLPSVILTDADKKTMPMMVSLLKGDIYKTELGSVYLGLTMTVLPLFVVYFLLSKYIVAGVALGSVKG